MALEQFPNLIVAKSVDSGETVDLAQFTDTGNLSYLGIYILAEALTGNERITLELRETDGTTVRDTSETIRLSDIEGFSTSNWLGWIRFKFNNPNLGTNLRVFATVTNYTRVGDTSVLNYLKAYLNNTYPTTATNLNSLPADIQIFKLV